MPTKSSYQRKACWGVPQWISSTQAWVATDKAMASVMTRPWAPVNSL